MYRLTDPDVATAGFTLLEVLVALALVAIGLSSIGGLVATSVRGAQSIEGHLTRLETARAVMAALPDRDQLESGTMSGMIADHSWQVQVLPLTANDFGFKPDSRWVPNAVIVTVSSLRPGGTMKVSTVNLRWSASK